MSHHIPVKLAGHVAEPVSSVRHVAMWLYWSDQTSATALDMTEAIHKFAGYGSPWTRRGRSIAYGPPPWRMAGRTLALWYRLADPDEARRHVPDGCTLDADPVVRARFWDLTHDGGLSAPTSANGPTEMSFREAVVAFPVVCAGVAGDFTTHMYADEPVYTAFGREAMGWPLRHGEIEVTHPASDDLARGGTASGRLKRDKREVMRIDLTLIRPLAESERPKGLPRWITWKVIPGVDGGVPAISQLVETGPSELKWGPIWAAEGHLEFGEGPRDELHFLQPREIVAAEYWDTIEFVIGPGRILAEL